MTFSWAEWSTVSRGCVPLAALAVSMALLSGCSVTGQTFNTGGLDRIVVGRTTLAQAAEDLGAQPVNTWRQGDSVLARWAYTGTVATDAVYFRQEVWLRFGPDGTFERVENSVNLPVNHRPRTEAEADREAAQAQARAAAAQGHPEPAVREVTEPIPVPAPPPIAPAPTSVPAASGPDAASGQPLLPEGSVVVPGATYDLQPKPR